MFKLVLEKAEEPDIKLPTSGESSKKQKSYRKVSISAWLTMPKSLIVYAKAFDCVDHSKLWKIQEQMGIPDHLTCMFLLRNLYVGQEATENWTWNNRLVPDRKKNMSRLYIVTLLMQSTSWETLGWRKHKLESRLPGEISITSDMQMTPPLWLEVKKN